MHACKAGVPLRSTMLSVYRSTAHDPPPTGFKSAQETSLSSLQGTHRAVHARLTLDAGVTFPCSTQVGSRQGMNAPAGTLGLCMSGARHRLSNPDRRASVPNQEGGTGYRRVIFVGRDRGWFAVL